MQLDDNAADAFMPAGNVGKRALFCSPTAATWRSCFHHGVFARADRNERSESHWVSWGLPTLETGMELCQKQ